VHADLDLAVQPAVGALPGVECLAVGIGEVVDPDVHVLAGSFDEGRQRTLPAELLAAEGQPPALDPAGAEDG